MIKKEKAARVAATNAPSRNAGAHSAISGVARPRAKAGGFMTFALSFLVAFLAFTVVLTLVMPSVAEFRPFAAAFSDPDDPDGESAILEEDFDYFVPSGSPFYDAFRDKKRVNCLLLGVNGGLTDTIMLVSFDTEAKHVDIISVPRDTFYHRNGYNGDAENKINAAFRKDPLNSAIAVSDVLLGMPINYYAVIEYDGVSNIVDSMGGVPFELTKDLNYEDRWDKPPLIIHLKKGFQTLSGTDAVKFLRFRKSYTEGDLGRIKEQQRFMVAAFKQALKSDLLKLAATITENVSSDITLSKMLYLARKAGGIAEDDISVYTMPGRPMSEAPYYVYPEPKQIEEMIRDIYSLEAATTTEAAVSGGALNER